MSNRPYVLPGRVDGWDPNAFNRARVKARLTFQQFADRMGVALSNAHGWSTTKRPPNKLLGKIARVLRCEQKDLLQ